MISRGPFQLCLFCEMGFYASENCTIRRITGRLPGAVLFTDYCKNIPGLLYILVSNFQWEIILFLLVLLINSYLFKHICLNKKCSECGWTQNCWECAVFLIVLLLLRCIWPQIHFHYGCFQKSGSGCFIQRILKSMSDHAVCDYSLRGSEWFWCLAVHLIHFDIVN